MRLDALRAALADRYRIERELGEGGMATVYLATDLKHDRKVAIKVLKPELAAAVGAERFIHEIATTAQLQHPNILPLFDSGEVRLSHPEGGEGSRSALFYVMPYVPGESLRERLNRNTQLGIDEAVGIATEVADALQYAHDQGVIHRDIKPENILLHNGRATVADFGIALAVTAAADGRMTGTGLSIGTPQYMSPEQAAADKHITNRSDIYSLGSVLYEMLTGEPPHSGPSPQAIVMQIVSHEPRPVRQLRKSVPPNVEAAVEMALEKLPADRFESAKAFADALRNPAFTRTTGRTRAVGVANSPWHRLGIPALAAATVLIAVLAAWGWLRPGPTSSVTRFPTTLGASGALDGITFRIEVALSPDGSALVYRDPLTGPGRLYIKHRNALTAQPLAGTEGGSGPFFSPDGAWIGFIAHGQLRKIPVAGGASLKLADSVDPLYNHPAWLDDGSIFYYDVSTLTLRRIPTPGAAPQVIASPATLGGRSPWLPTRLPASRGILFTAHLTKCIGPVSCRPSRVYVYDARRDTTRMLFDDAIGAWYVPTGQVLYLTSSGTLMAAPWNNDALMPTGPAVPILDGIQAPGFVVSNDGTALYLLGSPEFTPGPTPNAAVVWVDRSGHIQPVDSSWQVNTGGRYGANSSEVGWGLALSPNGRRIAITLLTDLGTDIWIKQLSTGALSRLTLYPGQDLAPAWTLDGRAVTFLSDRPIASGATPDPGRLALWEQAADGTSDARLLWNRDHPSDGFVSPDGRWMMLGVTGASGASSGSDILAARPGIDSVARQLVASGYDEKGAALSPDSHWLAYVSNEQGEDEVFVRPFPDVNSGKWLVSSGGGSAPVWAHHGHELFYANGGKMYVVEIRPGPPFSAAPPRALFEIPDGVRAGSPDRGTFAVSPDDQRFVMVRENSWEDMAGTPRLVMVQNFFQELRAKMKK
jgi:eukaryotic-like serine/threonine-protein kinase